jgi:DNA-directed RNA polymerase specialized sigma24 family protein
MPAPDSESSLFPRTQWTQLAGAAAADTDKLDGLIRLYWAPLKIYLVARFPSLRDRADELLQNFSTDKMLKEGWLKRADRSRGRFRDFLKRSLQNYILDHLDKAEVRNAPVSLDQLEQELPGPDSPAEAFDLMWARTVLAETLRQMEADCRGPEGDQPRRTQIWEMFQLRMLEPILNESEPMPYEQLVDRFGLKSPSEAFNMLLSAKRIFKMHLGRVVAGYAESDRATAAEIQALARFLEGLEKKG